jgi:hypothetical protein
MVNSEYELQIAQHPDHLQPVYINEAIVRGLNRSYIPFCH